MSPCGWKQKSLAGGRNDFLSGISSASPVRRAALAIYSKCSPPVAVWSLCRHDSTTRLTGFESGKDYGLMSPSPRRSRCGSTRPQFLQRASCGRSEYETKPAYASRVCLSGWRDPLRRGTPSLLSYHFILSSYLSFCHIREEKDLLKFSLLHLPWISYANKSSKLSHISVK